MGGRGGREGVRGEGVWRWGGREEEKIQRVKVTNINIIYILAKLEEGSESETN